MPKKSIRRSKRKVSSRRECREKVASKIKININEYKQGRYKSPSQAVAVSYSQVGKKYPACKKYLKKSVKKSKKKSVRKSRKNKK